jgi:membrane protease YdiL (CAAX protease family)
MAELAAAGFFCARWSATWGAAGGLVGGLVVGLVISFFKEIGWTGFATHVLKKRHGLLATGLIEGPPWGVMHGPFYAETAGGLSRRC